MESAIFFGLILLAAVTAACIAGLLRRRVTVSLQSCAVLVGIAVIVGVVDAVSMAIFAESYMPNPGATIVGSALIFAGLLAIFTPVAWILWALIARWRR